MASRAALLIDFENLVLGLESGGTDDLQLDPGLFFRLAEDDGSIVSAAAYADWRSPTFNRHQVELYQHGIELVHVLGRNRKNAVDIRLAIDAIELVHERPHIDTFIIVSGDRDFIHLLKQLRKHDKRLIGVAPARSISEDLAALCDRFVTYGDLRSTYAARDRAPASQRELQDLAVFKAALAGLFQKHVGEDGIFGAQLKPLIRRDISPAFDEASYGYSTFAHMMRSLHDIVRVETPAEGSDIRVYAHVPMSAKGKKAAPDPVVSLDDAVAKARARLSSEAMDWDRVTRDSILAMLHKAMGESTWFTMESLIHRFQDLELEQGQLVGGKRLKGYLSLCYESQVLGLDSADRETRLADRNLTLKPGYQQLEEFVARLEQTILGKTLSLFPSDDQGRVAHAKALLQLGDDDEEEEYLRDLLRRAKSTPRA